MMDDCEEKFGVTVISTTFFLHEVRRRKIKLLKIYQCLILNEGKDGCKGSLEAATISDTLYLFGQENVTFIRESSRK